MLVKVEVLALGLHFTYFKVIGVHLSLSCFNYILPKQSIHIISFEPISRGSLANSFHEFSMTTVSIDMIKEFWRATKRELVGIV